MRIKYGKNEKKELLERIIGKFKSILCSSLPPDFVDYTALQHDLNLRSVLWQLKFNIDLKVQAHTLWASK